MNWQKDSYQVSADPELLQLDRIHSYLSTEAYWCLSIPKDVVSRAVQGSLCFGVYKISEQSQLLQIGFARVVTDRTTFAWLCDVYIEKEHRGRGLSKWLMECLTCHPQLQGLRRFCLATRDAHGLYEKFGFKIIQSSDQTPIMWMEIKDNDLYKKMAVTSALESSVP